MRGGRRWIRGWRGRREERWVRVGRWAGDLEIALFELHAIASMIRLGERRLAANEDAKLRHHFKPETYRRLPSDLVRIKII